MFPTLNASRADGRFSLLPPQADTSPRAGHFLQVGTHRVGGGRARIAPEETWAALGPWVRYIPCKDSCLDPTNKHGYRLCLVGEGDVPLAEIMSVLRVGGYDGWLTLEWEKKWNPEIEEPEVAFPGYVEHMRRLLG